MKTIARFLFYTAALICLQPKPAAGQALGGQAMMGVDPADRSAPCLSEAGRDAIKAQLARATDSLIQAGTIAPMRAPMAAIKLGWPLAFMDSLHRRDFAYHGTSNFVDHNQAAGLQDWNCGSRTYEGHKGTDLFLWPFSWNQMDDGTVKIVAAAPGVIIQKSDGNFDRRCAMGSGVFWNAVYVRHADGTIAWYGHMKNGSLTTKAVGASVVQGEYLGLVGSSGSSTGPHLHLEIFNPDGTNADPWRGNCHAPDTLSWAQPRPYVDPAINALRTHGRPVQWTTCPSPTITNEKDRFAPGDTVYCYTYLRDIRPNDPISWAVLDSHGGTIYQLSSTWTNNAFNAAYWSFWTVPSSTLDPGQFTFRAVYKGKTYERKFQFGTAVGVSPRSQYAKATISLAGNAALLNLGTQTQEPLAAALCDVSGRTLRRYSVPTGQQKARLPLDGLSPGCYILRLPGQAVRFVRE